MFFLSKPLCTVWVLLYAFNASANPSVDNREEQATIAVQAAESIAAKAVSNTVDSAAVTEPIDKPVVATDFTQPNKVESAQIEPAPKAADSSIVAEVAINKPEVAADVAKPNETESAPVPKAADSSIAAEVATNKPEDAADVAKPNETESAPAPKAAADAAKSNEVKSAKIETTPAPNMVDTAPVATPASRELETLALSPVKFTLDSEEQKRAYASGVTLARYLKDNMLQQQKLHITLDPQIVLAGIVDTFKKEIKMDDATIQKTMAVFDEQVNILNKAKFEQESRHELEIGNAYQADFAKQDGVKKSKSGLLYLITAKGSGAAIKETDIVDIELIGTLVNGTEFEKTTKPITLKVSDVIPALRSGIKLAGNGGEVKLVVPPEQGYGPKGVLPGIPPNATLIFQIKVLKVGSGKSK